MVFAHDKRMLEYSLYWKIAHLLFRKSAHFYKWPIEKNRELTTMQVVSNDKSSRSFKKLLPKYQNMMSVAASTWEVKEVEVNDQVLDFFKCSNLLNLNIILNSIFEAARVEYSLSNVLTTAFMHASFMDESFDIIWISSFHYCIRRSIKIKHSSRRIGVRNFD